MKNVLAIIAMFACTSICFGDPPTITIDSDRGEDVGVAGNSVDPNGTGLFSLDPNNRTLIIKKGARVGQASGAYISENSNFRSATGNKLIVHGGDFRNSSISGACSVVAEIRDVNVNDNIVEINAGNNIVNVFGGRTRTGAASGNEVLVNNEVMTIGGDVFGGFVHNNGNAENNEVIINGVRIRGGVYGGFVFGLDHGNATGNTITIIGTPKFGNHTILYGGICAKDEFDKFTGNTLIIKETKGITVKGISNFENCKFYLSKDIKPQEPVLTARNGGCSWEKSRIIGDGVRSNYSPPCPVKLSKTNITIYSGVMKKGTKYTLIRSPQGFEGTEQTSKECKSKSIGPVAYKWDLEIVDSKDLPKAKDKDDSEDDSVDYEDPPKAKDLIATLVQKSITPSAAALCKGHGTAILLVNDGLETVY